MRSSMANENNISLIFSVICLYCITYTLSQDFLTMLPKDGKCPNPTSRECSLDNSDKCFLDSECPAKQKCCDDACNLLSCTDPKIMLATCNIAVDLGFVIDASSSITPNNFNKIKVFMKNLVKEYDIREGATHVAAIVFGDKSQVLFDFNALRDKDLTSENVEKSIDRIPHLTGDNRVDLALAMANTHMFSLNGGTRTNAPRILLLLTDGFVAKDSKKSFSMNSVWDASDRLKSNDVQVFVLGIGGNVQSSQLQQISSGPKKMFLSKDYNDLRTGFKEIAIRSCKACSDIVDVGFAIPSNSFAQFEDLRDFIKTTLDYFVLGMKNVQVGLIIYNNEAKVAIKFDETYDLTDLKVHLNKIRYVATSGRNRFDALFQTAANDLFTIRGGVRQGAAKKLIVVAEAPIVGSQRDIDDGVEQLKSLGVDIIGVAYGSDVSKSAVKLISTFPVEVYYKEATTITDLLSQLPRSVVESSCKGKKGKCPYTKVPEKCPVNTFQECEVDVDCKENHKCCQDGCNRQCTAPIQGCFRALEIAFLVDTSFTISDEEVHRMKDFMKNVANGFSISETGARFSIVTYNKEAEVQLKFNDNFNAKMIANKIDKLDKTRNRERRLDIGLKLTQSDVFSLKGGIRQGVPLVLIVMTGGPPSSSLEQLKDISSSLKNSVTIWTIGSGPSASAEYLKVIASQEDQSLKTTFFEQLFPLATKITDRLCSEKSGKCPSPMERFCLVEKDECAGDYECPGFSKCCYDGCRKRCSNPSWECTRPLDLALVMESSGNIGEKNFKALKMFAKDLVKALNVDNSLTEIGLISYGESVSRHLDFKKFKGIYNKEDNILRSIDRLMYTRESSSAAHEALEFAYNQLFTFEGGSRPDAVRGLIFITDGILKENIGKIFDASMSLKRAGVAIYPVAASKTPNLPALEKIASHASTEHVFLTTSLPAIIQYVHQLSKEACKAEAPPREINVIKGLPGDRGPPGKKGVPGPSGPPGPQGHSGLTGSGGQHGAPGTPGRSGNSGLNGRPGPPGPLYIRMSRQDGSGQTRTVVISPVRSVSQTGQIGRVGLRGPLGTTGSSGPSGEQGVIGTPGMSGRRGAIGDTGRNGLSGLPGRGGAPGTRGQKGATSDTGQPGLPGIKGKKGHEANKGVSGIHGEQGKTGDSGLQGGRGKRGRKGTRGIPGINGKIGSQGTTGNWGRKGVEGDLGVTGPVGLRGSMGSMGKRGIKGKPGPLGPPGPQGMPGESGSAGLAGFSGAPGADGRKGANGNPGAKGSVGDPGITGNTGDRGPTGPTGLVGGVGPPGWNGKKGKDGKDGIKGRLGEKGIMGDMGVSGIDGASGPIGKIGIQGDTGFAGPEGNEGERGIQGSQGYVGVDGSPGTKGKIGIRGKSGRNGRKGSRGRFGKVGNTGKPGKRGSKGRIGRPGNDGRQGPFGAPGINGHIGTAGEKGTMGYLGIKGQIGLKGSPGPQGIAGIPGILGGPGAKGTKGLSGDSGQPGFLGTAGEQGHRGAEGEEGLPGSQGPPGSQGKKGARGLVGDKGFMGDTGDDGDNGEQGERGDEGNEGEIGIPGLDGALGIPGERGIAGYLGSQGTPGTPGSPGNSGIGGLEGNVGRPGLEGDKGKKGDIGIQGATGFAGGDGDDGMDGLSGPAGSPGHNGEEGGEGIPGIVGEAGQIGPKGGKGLAGPPGPGGTSGAIGPVGPYGRLGEIGPRGIKGDTGIPGSQGIPGHAGELGEHGTAGHPGIRGERGLRGTTGPEGPKGPLGFPGPTGDRGDVGGLGGSGVLGKKGKQGGSGEVGEAGPFGTTGPAGEQGIAGPPGEQSFQGVPGNPGMFGNTGAPGALGDQGFIGHAGIAGEEGQIGMPGRNGKPGTPGKYGKRGGKGFQGPSGGYGDPGEQGPPGATGLKGARGYTGPQGPHGDQGPTGSAGLPGSLGSVGLEGLQGQTGITGEKGDGGAEGVDGPPGPRGARGRKGQKGDKGPSGTNGDKGSQGVQGPMGFEGTFGDRGEKGSYGNIGSLGKKGLGGNRGPMGSRGKDGQVGSVGLTGLIGFSGLSGDEGSKGPTGIMGPPGPPGPPGGSSSSASTGQPSSNSDPPSYYHGADKDKKETPTSPEELEMEFLIRLDRLQDDFSSFRKPTGTKLFPALTCKNLFKDHPYLKTGEYWLDPNEGAPEDAVLVYCALENKLSCILPITPKTQIKQWYRGADGYKWFKQEIDDTFKFRYNVEAIQLTFLQLLSDKVSQKITYHCIKSTVWHDQNNNVTHSMKFLGDNEREYKATTPRKHRPTVVRDDCKVKDNKKRTTVIEILTKNTARLPIRDIALYDIGQDGEQFGLELGPVCFN